MAQLLSTTELRQHLEDLRNILRHFDYSSLQNIRFFNLDSLYAYMEHVEGNPFQDQYKALQRELDFIQPYLPFVSSERASQFLKAMSETKDDTDILEIKKDFTQKLRKDFLNLARITTSDDEWKRVMDTCEEIRLHKEEMSLASY